MAQEKLYFQTLATMLKAGLPILQSIEQMQQQDKEHTQAWAKVAKRVAAGQTLSMAMEQQQLLTAYQRQIMHTAEQAGLVELAFRDLARQQQLVRTRQKQVRSQLVVPVITVMVAFMVSALLASLNGSQSLTIVILFLMVKLIVLGAAVKAVVFLLQQDSNFWLNCLMLLPRRALLPCLYQASVFRLLYWQLKVGLDFQQSFANASALLSHAKLKHQLSLCADYCGQGLSVQQAMLQSQLPISKSFMQQLHSAKQQAASQATQYALTLNQQQLEVHIKSNLQLLKAAIFSGVLLQVLIALSLA